MSAPVNFYADFKGLASLKKDAVEQDPKALREAARQFESLFTQMMLKSMRDAGRSLRSKDSLMESDQTDFYSDMFDSQLSTQMTKGKGVGLAEMLVKQLRGVTLPESADAMTKLKIPGVTTLNHMPPSNAPIALNLNPALSPAVIESTAPVTASITDDGEIRTWCGNADDVNEVGAGPVQDPSDLSRLALQVARARAELPGSISLAPVNGDSEILPVSRPSSLVSASAPAAEPLATTPDEFVSQLWPHAKAAAAELGVDPHMLIAHAALETGWGKSIPCNADGTNSFNLFGIKAGSKWQGPAVGVNTLEFEGGIAVRRRASFRAYDSPADSFRDYASLIKSSPRYAAALGKGGDAAAFAKALQQGGYATDPNYADKLTAVAERLRASLKTDSSQPLALGRRVSTGSVGQT